MNGLSDEEGLGRKDAVALVVAFVEIPGTMSWI